MGTLINCGLILLGGVIGLLFKRAVSEGMERSVQKAVGVAVVMVGLCGALNVMLHIEDGRLKSSGELLLVVSLALGTFVGEALKLDRRIDDGCKAIENRFKASNFSAGFITASLIYCIGAMAIVGSIQDGLLGDSSTLITKGIIDGITSVVLAATLGYGVLLSVIPVLIYQGAMTLLAGTLETVLKGQLLDNICMVGYVLVLCIGINFLSNKDNQIKTVNMLPAVLVPVGYELLRALARCALNG
ncbi:MAG: DUF554 domain-containing protein [Oscillospiraceae bacterium]|nr:DUF554 domain-containing protein [Oscillospiraceae bacterium]